MPLTQAGIIGLHAWLVEPRGESEDVIISGAEAAYLASIIGPTYHVFEQAGNEHSLQHPVACRPDLLGCEVQKLTAKLTEPPVPDGRYRVDLSDGELVFAELETPLRRRGNENCARIGS